MKHSKLAIMLALWFAATAAPAQPQLITDGDDFLVSTDEVLPDDIYRQESPKVAVGPGGEFIVTWAHYPSTFRGRSFAPDTTPGSEFVIANGGGYRLPAETIAMSQAPDGQVVVTWLGTPPLGTPILPAIFGRRYGLDSTAEDDSFVASQNPQSGNSRPAVAREADGDYVMVWESFEADDHNGSTSAGVRGRRFGADGAALGDAFWINESGGRHPDVAIVPGGDFLVIWTDSGIHGRLYSSNGEPVTGAFTVDTGGSGPRISAASGGRFMIVWSTFESNDQGVPAEDIWGRLFASDAVPLGEAFQINTYTSGRQDLPAIASGPDGEYVVTWRTRGAIGTEEETNNVRARLLAADGSPVGNDFQVNTTTNAIQAAWHGPDVSIGQDGDVVIVWDQRAALTPTFESSIRGRRFELPALPQQPTPCDDPRLLCLGDSGRFEIEVEWTDFDGASGSGRRVPGIARTPDSGLFYFFDPDNWELLIKVLDGCGTNGHYWVFSAATTNVGYTITVTDTLADHVNIYTNPLGSAAAAITDVEAFSTCP